MSGPACPTAPAAVAPQSFLNCLGYILTPQVWKQAQQAAGRRRALRWQRQPLILVLLVMTWCAGDSLPERFETARAFYVACHQRRRRPGKTFAGFEKALGKMPLRVLRAVAGAVRQRLAAVFAERFRVDGWIPLGCDGSRLACSRSAELEQRLGVRAKKRRRRKKKIGPAGRPGPKPELGPGLPENPKKPKAGPDAPQIWVTAVVHLGLGLLWSWRLGKGTASERVHLRQLVATLPRGALLVADAGYVGYALLNALQAAGLCFLIRLTSRAPLYVPDKSALKHYCEGLVYYWPQKVQKHDLPPIPVRLLRIRGDQTDVWLITNVLEEHRLPRKTAGKFYRWRWRNEGLFRTYGDQIAAVLVEPIAGNMGVVPPGPDFLEGLRRMTREFGSLLVFDEVITGFRVAPGGAQEKYGVAADVTCLGKILGHGMPLGAYGGRRDILGMVAPLGPVYQAGTLAGNPMAMAAGQATMSQLRPSLYASLEKRSAQLETGLRDAADDADMEVQVPRVGSMMGIFFGPEPVRNFRDAQAMNKTTYGRFFWALLKGGVYFPPAPFESFFLSSSHRGPEVERTIEAAAAALREVRNS